MLFTFPYLHLRALTLILFSLVQAFATLTLGLIIGLVYIWKVGLVELGMSARAHQRRMVIDLDCLAVCVPFVIFTGYVRLVGYPGPFYA